MSSQLVTHAKVKHALMPKHQIRKFKKRIVTVKTFWFEKIKRPVKWP